MNLKRVSSVVKEPVARGIEKTLTELLVAVVRYSIKAEYGVRSIHPGAYTDTLRQNTKFKTSKNISTLMIRNNQR